MGARKPLTERERYIARKCNVLVESIWNRASSVYESRERSAPRVRQLLKAREKNSTNNRWREFYEKLEQGIHTIEEFIEHKRLYGELDKYQGYLYGDYVRAVMDVEGKSEEEIRRINVMEAI